MPITGLLVWKALKIMILTTGNFHIQTNLRYENGSTFGLKSYLLSLCKEFYWDFWKAAFCFCFLFFNNSQQFSLLNFIFHPILPWGILSIAQLQLNSFLLVLYLRQYLWVLFLCLSISKTGRLIEFWLWHSAGCYYGSCNIWHTQLLL